MKKNAPKDIPSRPPTSPNEDSERVLKVDIQSEEFTQKIFDLSHAYTVEGKAAPTAGVRLKGEEPLSLFAFNEIHEEEFVSRSELTESLIDNGFNQASLKFLSPTFELGRSYRKMRSYHKSSYYRVIYYYQASMKLTKNLVEPIPAFVEGIETALTGANLFEKYSALQAVFREFGYVWAQKVILGGRITVSEIITEHKNDTEKKTKALAEAKASVGGTITGFGKAGFGAGFTADRGAINAADFSNQQSRLRIIGGRPTSHTLEDRTGWQDSLDFEPSTWEVILREELIPIYELLDSRLLAQVKEVMEAPLGMVGITFQHKLSMYNGETKLPLSWRKLYYGHSSGNTGIIVATGPFDDYVDKVDTKLWAIVKCPSNDDNSAFIRFGDTVYVQPATGNKYDGELYLHGSQNRDAPLTKGAPEVSLRYFPNGPNKAAEWTILPCDDHPGAEIDLDTTMHKTTYLTIHEPFRFRHKVTDNHYLSSHKVTLESIRVRKNPNQPNSPFSLYPPMLKDVRGYDYLASKLNEVLMLDWSQIEKEGGIPDMWKFSAMTVKELKRNIEADVLSSTKEDDPILPYNVDNVFELERECKIVDVVESATEGGDIALEKEEQTSNEANIKITNEGDRPVLPYDVDDTLELEQKSKMVYDVERENLILPYNVDVAPELEEHESKAESVSEVEVPIYPYSVDVAPELEEHEIKSNVAAESVSEVLDTIRPYDVGVAPELEDHESKSEVAAESISEVEGPIRPYDVDVAPELEECESKADVAAESVSEVERSKAPEFVAEVESPILQNDMECAFEPNVDTKEDKYEYAETGFHNWLNKAQPNEEGNLDTANLTRSRSNAGGASIKGAQLVDEDISLDRAAYSNSYPITNVAPAARSVPVPASYTEYVAFESKTQGNKKQFRELTAGAMEGKGPSVLYAIDGGLDAVLELEEQEVVAHSTADREDPIFQYGMGGAFELEQVAKIEDDVESATEKEHLILPYYVEGVFVEGEQESKETDAESPTEEECVILPYDVDGAFELEESKMEIVPDSVNEGNGPIIPYYVDGTLVREEYESKVEDALESVSEVEDLILLYDVGVGLELEQENKIEVVEMESSPNLSYNADNALRLNADTKEPFSKAEVPFYDWLEMSLPEEEKEDTELVEFHQLGKKIAEFINNKDRLVTLMPAYLLGDINWDTYSLGIRLFMRWQLDEHELQNVNKIIEKYGKAFRGVEQLVFVGVAASDGKPSDGSNNEGKEDDGHGRRIGQNDGKNNIYQSRDSDAGPAENQAQSSRKHQSNEGGDSCSGGVGPSDLDNFGEGSTFLRTGAGGAGRSQNTSGNDDEGGDDGGLSRREEIDSTQLMLQNWSRLFGSFCERLCCCPSEEFRYHRIAEVEENLQLEVLAPSCAVDGSREDVTNECKETITSPLPPKPSHPFDKSCQITLTSSAPESSNEITATAAGLHISTEEIDPDSNACASRPKIMNDIKGTNVSQGINATGSVFHNSNVNVFNENFPSARTHDVPEEPKFTVNVSTFSKATLKGKEQEFTINFILKITISKFSHKLELSKIIFEGGTQHLTDNERYILNNFRIKFSSGTVNASFGNIQPLEKAKDYRRIKHTACRGIYQWHHNIDDVNVLLDLRHDLETHSAEYEWMGAEPTEYSIDIRVNLLVVRNLTRGMRRDIMDIFRKDHDLVNHVSMRVNIPRHDKENIKYETPQCTWKVATEVEHGEQGSGLMNIPNEFSQLSSCTKRCCQLVAGIYAIEHLQCSNKRCKHLINSN